MYGLGLSTPEDIAFATIDELIAEDLFRPRITSVVQPTYEIGYRAVEVLLDRIRSVSYTHLDVYKRQTMGMPIASKP